MSEPKDERWMSFQSRVKEEGRATLPNNRSTGLAIVSAHIVIDHNGYPLCWVVQHGKRIEPSKNARDVLSLLLGSMGSDTGGGGDE